MAKLKVFELLDYIESIANSRHSSEIYLVDVGYLSYFSAVFSGKLLELRFRFYSGIWLLESDFSLRKEAFPQYKSHRKENSLTQLARENRMRISGDSNLLRISARGYEADDFVALLLLFLSRYSSVFRKPQNLCIIGGDKDYAQLEHLTCSFGPLRILGFYSCNQERILPSQTLLKKLPKWVISCFPEVPSPLDYVIVQALLGDSSDDIPRVLYMKDQEILETSLKIPIDQKHPMDRLEYLHKALNEKQYQMFLKNLQLALFPHYSLLYSGEFEKVLPVLWRYHHPDEVFDSEALENLNQKLRIDYPVIDPFDW